MPTPLAQSPARPGAVPTLVRAALLGLAALIGWAAWPGRAAAGPGAGLVFDPGVSDRLFWLAQVPTEVYGQPISEIRFEGNRRVESDAMLLELDSSPSELVTGKKLARDLRNLWALGYFEDIRVEAELTAAGVVLTYVVKERPTVRKIIVEGNDKVKLDDINEQLDLAPNEVLDLGKVKANVEKVRQHYTEEGFFLADVDYAIRPVEDEPGKVDIALVIDEAAEVVVRGITFVGNKAFTDDQLRKAMITRVGGYLSLITKRAGGVYNQEAFKQDYANLRAFYANDGYLDADPKTPPELALSPDRRFVHLTIPIDEGPQYTIGEIRAREVLGRGEKELFPEEVLAESIDPVLKIGDVASYDKVRTILQDIERRYKDNGYAYVNVIPNTRQDRENLKLYVLFEIQKGPLVYIERINVLGNERTADKVIRREIPLREGDLYSETAKEMSELNVLRLGYFSEVTVNTARGSADDMIVLNVEVTERLTGTFQIGAGFSTIENFVLQGQVSYDNFLGRGTSVSLVAQLSSLRRLFNFRYYTRYFLDSKWQFVFSVFNSRNIFPSFTRDSTGFSVEWGYPIPRVPNLVVWAGYDLEHVAVGFGNFGGLSSGIFSPGALVSVPQQALISNLFANGFTSALTSRIAYDTRDSFLFPTSGMFHQISGQFATQWLGSQNRYNRYLLDSRIYVPVIKSKQSFRAWVVFKTRLQVGFVHSMSPLGVPVFERYFAGGIFAAGGIRGYRMRSLSPKIKVQSSPDPTANLIPYEVGGNILAALNVELEFMIVPPANIKGVIFLDSGNTFNTESVYCTDPDPANLPKSDPCVSFRFRDLRVSSGFGLRWQSPIGPLRFEWGFPLDRMQGTELLPRAEDPVVFEFNVGTGF